MIKVYCNSIICYLCNYCTQVVSVLVLQGKDCTDWWHSGLYEHFCRKLRCCVFSLLSIPFLRSEEHTSELQSRENLVCRLLLEKKKTACGTRARSCVSRRLSSFLCCSGDHLHLHSFPTRRSSDLATSVTTALRWFPSWSCRGRIAPIGGIPDCTNISAGSCVVAFSAFSPYPS